MEPSSPEVTRLLHDLTAGKASAADQLIPLIYAELHQIAEQQMRRERDDHTLQPTLLVHDAFLRLAGNSASWVDRQHFFSLAAQAMRRLLLDHARRSKSQKRGAGARRVELRDDLLSSESAEDATVDSEALDAALTRLAQLDERQARIVELRFFGGLSVDETAEVVGVSPATVKRDWQFARVWLRREISQDSDVA